MSGRPAKKGCNSRISGMKWKAVWCAFIRNKSFKSFLIVVVVLFFNAFHLCSLSNITIEQYVMLFVSIYESRSQTMCLLSLFLYSSSLLNLQSIQPPSILVQMAFFSLFLSSTWMNSWIKSSRLILSSSTNTQSLTRTLKIFHPSHI